jgi:hypothetical protein
VFREEREIERLAEGTWPGPLVQGLGGGGSGVRQHAHLTLEAQKSGVMQSAVGTAGQVRFSGDDGSRAG